MRPTPTIKAGPEPEGQGLRAVVTKVSHDVVPAGVGLGRSAAVRAKTRLGVAEVAAGRARSWEKEAGG